MRSAKLSSSIFNPGARCSISTLRIIANSSRRRRKCGICDHAPRFPLRPQPALNFRHLHQVRPGMLRRGRRQPILDARGECIEAGVGRLCQIGSCSDETIDGSGHLYRVLRAHGIVWHRAPDGLYRHISSRTCFDSASGAPGASHHRPFKTHRMASPILGMRSYRRTRVLFSPGRRRA